MSYCEIFVDIHLINGDVVTLRNDCIGGFEHKRYTGATLDSDFSDGEIMLRVTTSYEDDVHVIAIPLTSICWIDSRYEFVDWKAYKLKQNKKNGKESFDTHD